MEHQDVLKFWFEEIESKQWWIKDEAFDAMIKERFFDLLQAATQAELFEWRQTAEGRLAEIIVLDQFSRNVFRDTAKAFAQDALALALAQEAIAAGAPDQLTDRQLPFLYMPFMHSESAKIHEVAMTLFSQPRASGNLEYEKKHKLIIDRFGRYPHRNEILGRVSSNEEIEFLKTPNSSF